MNFMLDIQRTFLPELVLCVFILFNTMISVFAGKTAYRISRWVGVLGIACTLFSTLFVQPYTFNGFFSSFQSNGFTLFCKILILVSAFLVVFMSQAVVKTRREKAFEFFTMIMISVLGGMCMISANDFLILFVSMEILTISSCILIAFAKGSQAKKSSIMYLITASIASAIFLFGVSYLYGFSGLINFNEIMNFYNENYPTISFSFALILITFGLLFKIGAVPFHNWVADVFDGTSYPIAAFLSVIPKIAGFAVLIKFCMYPVSSNLQKQ